MLNIYNSRTDDFKVDHIRIIINQLIQNIQSREKLVNNPFAYYRIFSRENC